MSMLRLLCIGAIALPLASITPPGDETSTTRQAFVSGESFANVPPAPWVDDDPADSLYRVARQALNDESYRRAAALFAQIESRYPRSVYTPDAPYWRAFALYKAGREDDLRKALEVLDAQVRKYPQARTIGDGRSLAVRIRGALAKRGDADAAEAVTSTASQRVNCTGADRDDRNDIRTEALNALLQMDAESAVPIIKEVLQKRDSCSASLRAKAVFLLSQKPAAETEALLVDAVRNDPDREVREQAVFWLGQVRTERAAQALETIALSSPDEALRAKAVFALGQQNMSRGAMLIRRLAEDAGTPRSIREQAIFQLGQHRSTENAEFLRALFGRLSRSDDDALRKHVLFALSQMDGVGNDRWLLGIALDPSQSVDVRKHALWTAGQADIPARALVELYDRLADSQMKEQLIWVLSDTKDRAASDKLVDIAQKDRDPEMRKKAIFWLGQKNDPRVRQILLDILNKG